MQPHRLAVLMDPIASIHYEKDSTLAMLWEAQDRGYEIFYFELPDLFLEAGLPVATSRRLTVARDAKAWFQLGPALRLSLATLDVILMRKDPPFDAAYLHATYLLDAAKAAGVVVVNDPQALRDANEKIFATHFPAFTPPTLVTQSISALTDFWRQHGEIVCKPLNGMGGTDVFRLPPQEVNAAVIFETLTHGGTAFIMAQQFIPAIKDGDKRILFINGEPLSHALLRIPQGNEWRGNLAVGAKGKVLPLTARDIEICRAVGPILRERGLLFVGIDVIGDYLTEINVTSPTCLREIEAVVPLGACAQLFEVIEEKVRAKK